MSLPILFRKSALSTVQRDRPILPLAVVAPLCLVGALFVPWWLTVGTMVFAAWRFWRLVR